MSRSTTSGLGIGITFSMRTGTSGTWAPDRLDNAGDPPLDLTGPVTAIAVDPADHSGKSIYITTENEPQDTRLVRPAAEGGYGFDSLWNDDFHHSAIVALTGKHPAYYTDYRGTPQEFISAVKRGYLYQGQRYSWQGGQPNERASRRAPDPSRSGTRTAAATPARQRGDRCGSRWRPGRDGGGWWRRRPAIRRSRVRCR